MRPVMSNTSGEGGEGGEGSQTPTGSRKLPPRRLRLTLAWRRIRISRARLLSGKLYLLV